MSLAGLRDISVIETPPEGRRPVRTYVGPYDEDLVRKAIEREIEREGQAFVLHNRIDSLPETTERLRALVPGARFTEAHGQMDEHALEETMLTFLRGEADCLVTTTIIESGLDIPTANTLIVERADQLGLEPGVPDPRPGRALSRARLRLPALPLGRGADRGGGGAALDPRRPHRARLRLPDRDARPRHPRRRQPARRRAVRPRRRGRLRALLPDDRRGGGRGRRGGEEAARRRRSRSASTSRSTPTCRPPSSPSRRPRSTSTAASSRPASRASCGRSATSSATASASCRRRPRTC